MIWLLLIALYGAWLWFTRRDIVINGELYLRRLFLTPRWLPKRLFLHYIRRSDAGRDLHDHPWRFRTIVLMRGYTELLPGGKVRVLKPGDTVVNEATHTHRVLLPGDIEEGKPRPAITLLVVDKATREWGFHTENGWVQWQDYTHAEDKPVPAEDRISA